MFCRGVVPGRMCGRPPSHVPRTEAQLSQIEADHRVYDLYIWLAWRLEEAFPDRPLVEQWRAACSELIRRGLEGMSRGRGSLGRRVSSSSSRPFSPFPIPFQHTYWWPQSFSSVIAWTAVDERPTNRAADIQHTPSSKLHDICHLHSANLEQQTAKHWNRY